MSAALLDGRALAKTLTESLKPRIAAVVKARGRTPGLLVVSSADADRSAGAFRKSQAKACEAAGLRWRSLAGTWAFAGDVLEAVAREPDYDGVVFDLPLPSTVDVAELLAGLPPARDAEGVTAARFGSLMEAKSLDEIRRRGLIAPCTALAIAELLRSTKLPLAGKTAVVLGRSNVVGKPAAHLLSCMDLTVTLCHSKTRDLAKVVAAADVVVAAIGRPRFVKASWIREGAVVIDAGINADGGALCGDVDPEAGAKAAFLTPVPGGVGPVTTAMLISNTVTLAETGAKR